MTAQGLSLAYLSAVDVIAKAIGKAPLPAGISTAEAGDWVLSINNGREPVMHDGNELGPWELFAESKKYLVFGIMNPVSGMLGGISEDMFIDEMKALDAELSA
jgi:hypothetical protein